MLSAPEERHFQAEEMSSQAPELSSQVRDSEFEAREYTFLGQGWCIPVPGIASRRTRG
jgi:hypothetical protein